MTFFGFMRLLRRHWVMMVTLPIVLAAAVFGLTLLMPSEYTATTTMYVLARGESVETGFVTYSDLSAGQMLTSDVATLMGSDRVRNTVAQAIGIDDIDDYKFDIESSSTTRVITLSVAGTNPEMAAKIASATVDEVSRVATEIMKIESVNVIDAAIVPDEPSGPNRPLLTIAGFVLGLLVALLIVVIRDIADTRVRDGDEAQELAGVPIVGHFPEIGV